MTILITGGASGLGEAITRTLSVNSTNTIYFTYNNSKVKASKLQEEFSNAHAIKCDFNIKEELDLLKSKIETLEIEVDVLINNAFNGSITPQHFHKMSSERFLNDFVNNMLPTIEITQTVIKNFRKRKQGRIITVLTSYLVGNPPAGLSSYIGCKAYLEKLTKIWASENSKFNIISNSISPSFMQTGLTDDVDERVVDQMISNHPQQKLLDIYEVADTVKFLVNCSSHINGQDILLNAGSNLK